VRKPRSAFWLPRRFGQRAIFGARPWNRRAAEQTQRREDDRAEEELLGEEKAVPHGPHPSRIDRPPVSPFANWLPVD
jgi:hypothetical protein